MDNIVTQKNVEEKEPDNIVTKKVVEETKQKLIKPTENVESDFEIISKENPTSEEKTAVRVESKKEEVADIKEVEKKLENDHKSSGTEERKKSIVDISVIKEAGDSDNTIQKGNDLQESVSSMPGMTKSVSQEILKKSDVTELKQIAQDLAEEDRRENKEEEEEGSVIDISVVEENNEKEEDIGTVDGLEAEILADDEEHVVRVSLKSDRLGQESFIYAIMTGALTTGCAGGDHHPRGGRAGGGAHPDHTAHPAPGVRHGGAGGRHIRPDFLHKCLDQLILSRLVHQEYLKPVENKSSCTHENNLHLYHNFIFTLTLNFSTTRSKRRL